MLQNIDPFQYPNLVPAKPSDDLTHALDVWIHEYYSGLASDKNNEGAKSQVAFILEHGGHADLDRIFTREYGGERNFYFLVASAWGHCFVGRKDTDIKFCLAIRRDDEDRTPIIIDARRISTMESLDKNETTDLMESFQDNPEWIEDPDTWGWMRCDRVADVPSVWWAAIKEFFDRRAAAGIKAAIA